MQEWCILPSIPRQLFSRWGYPQVDLFASARNTQCHCFSINRLDHQALGIHALHQEWCFPLVCFSSPSANPSNSGETSSISGDSNPNHTLVDRSHVARGVITLSQCRLIFLPIPALIQQGNRELRSLQLVAWKLCAASSEKEAWIRSWLPLSQVQLGSRLTKHTTQPGNPGIPGAIPRTWIDFLWQRRD